jgi:hypothetical protein
MLKPLTKEQWECFDPKAQWDITVALRGPDINSADVVKWFSTSVIRGKLRNIRRVGGMVNKDLNLVIIPSLDRALCKALGAFSPHHFFGHVQEAADLLEIPFTVVPSDPWLSAISLSSIWKSAEIFLEALPKGSSKDELSRHLETFIKRGGY